MRIYETIKYKDFIANLYLLPETYQWEWVCEETKNRLKLSITYTFEEVLERGKTWLAGLYNMK